MGNCLKSPSQQYNPLDQQQNQLDKVIKDQIADIVSFVKSLEQNKKIKYKKLKHQQLSESSPSSSLVSVSLNFLSNQIIDDDKCKKIIKTRNLLHSLTILTSYKQNVHINQEEDEQTFEIRKNSRSCLSSIQQCGEISVQVKLLTVGYAYVLVNAFSTAGGMGEEKNWEISNGLQYIYWFINSLHRGRNNTLHIPNFLDYNHLERNYEEPSFPPQHALVKTCLEQIEQEGGIEELETQLINKGLFDDIMNNVKQVKGVILNYYITKRIPRSAKYLQ